MMLRFWFPFSYGLFSSLHSYSWRRWWIKLGLGEGKETGDGNGDVESEKATGAEDARGGRRERREKGEGEERVIRALDNNVVMDDGFDADVISYQILHVCWNRVERRVSLHVITGRCSAVQCSASNIVKLVPSSHVDAQCCLVIHGSFAPSLLPPPRPPATAHLPDSPIIHVPRSHLPGNSASCGASPSHNLPSQHALSRRYLGGLFSARQLSNEESASHQLALITSLSMEPSFLHQTLS